MKAAVISLGSTSSQWVAEAMASHFQQVDMIQLKEIEVHLGKEAGIFYHGKPLPSYDCVYLKGSFHYAHLLRSLASMLEGQVPYLPLKANSFTIVHNKLLTHLVLQQKNIPMPRTYVSPTIAMAKSLLQAVHYPIVMKFPEGTQGKGVMFADSYASASSLLDALGALRQPFIIQEYIETSGTDIRTLVVGNKVLAAMRRTAKTDEKRANLHAGGQGESVTLSSEVQAIAINTAKALEADVCGVDILESPLGPLVIEANISPGLQGIQKTTKINLAEKIAHFFAQKTEEALQTVKEKNSKEVMKEIKMNGGTAQEIVTTLQFCGQRILLPEVATTFPKFNDQPEYILRVKQGKMEIEEMK